MNEFFQEAIRNPFTWGLLLGLLIAAFIWKSGFTARRQSNREIRRMGGELRDLQSHLNTQLKINASGNETLQKELETLKIQNENLRVNLTTYQQKPGRAEQQQLHIYEMAVRLMREQAPGFAPAWEKAVRQAEAELDAAESGLKRLVRRVMPMLGNTSQHATGASAEEAAADHPEADPKAGMKQDAGRN